MLVRTATVMCIGHTGTFLCERFAAAASGLPESIRFTSKKLRALSQWQIWLSSSSVHMLASGKLAEAICSENSLALGARECAESNKSMSNFLRRRAGFIWQSSQRVWSKGACKDFRRRAEKPKLCQRAAGASTTRAKALLHTNCEWFGFRTYVGQIPS